MKSMYKILRIYIPKTTTIILLLFLSLTTRTQVIDSAFLIKQWKASWITVPQSNPAGYGVYYFRKGFELIAIPKSYPIHVSADNRYKLFVNETLVSIGPARGDMLHWNFETVDLAPFLRVGHNVVAAQVWNEGELRMKPRHLIPTIAGNAYPIVATPQLRSYFQLTM
jgi:alpha-L-rhamnosidase